jgi:hypothetical protein
METAAQSVNQPEPQSDLSAGIEDKGYMVRMIGISKSFPGVQALKSVNFDLKRG